MIQHTRERRGKHFKYLSFLEAFTIKYVTTWNEISLCDCLRRVFIIACLHFKYFPIIVFNFNFKFFERKNIKIYVYVNKNVYWLLTQKTHKKWCSIFVERWWSSGRYRDVKMYVKTNYWFYSFEKSEVSFYRFSTIVEELKTTWFSLL